MWGEPYRCICYIPWGTEISASGSVVGGWKTRVRAMKMETSATGGDSHVWITDGKVKIGPRRVIPLCVAAVEYPGLLQKLSHMRPLPRKSLDENYQPTKFFVRTVMPAMAEQ